MRKLLSFGVIAFTLFVSVAESYDDCEPVTLGTSSQSMATQAENNVEALHLEDSHDVPCCPPEGGQCSQCFCGQSIVFNSQKLPDLTYEKHRYRVSRLPTIYDFYYSNLLRPPIYS